MSATQPLDAYIAAHDYMLPKFCRDACSGKLDWGSAGQFDNGACYVLIHQHAFGREAELLSGHINDVLLAWSSASRQIATGIPS